MSIPEKDYKLTAGSPQELNQELQKLYELKIIEYKIIGKERFIVGFTKEFVKFSNENRQKIVDEAQKIYLDMIKREPILEDDPAAVGMTYYSTTFVSYLKHTFQLEKVDINNVEYLGRLVARIEEINETFQEIKRGEN